MEKVGCDTAIVKVSAKLMGSSEAGAALHTPTSAYHWMQDSLGRECNLGQGDSCQSKQSLKMADS